MTAVDGLWSSLLSTTRAQRRWRKAIQAAVPEMRVVVARPIAVNLAPVAEMIGTALGRFRVVPDDWGKLPTSTTTEPPAEFQALLEPFLAPLVAALQTRRVNVPAQFMQLVQQLSAVGFERGDEAGGGFVLDLGRLAVLDPIESDRELGICPVPLYAFTEEEVEVLDSGVSVDAAREVLSRHDLLQYFFPAPDQVALGLIERTQTSPEVLLERLQAVPNLGHPFAAYELVPPDTRLQDVLAALQDKGFVTEGEVSIEVTEPGRAVRQMIKFSPRESLLSKVLNRFSLTFDISRLFGGS